MHKLTLTMQAPYREGYNAINISAMPHHKTVTILTATADSPDVLRYVAEDLQVRWKNHLTVNIEEVNNAVGK